MSDAWKVEGDLTIYRAAELKPALAAALEGVGPFAIDLARVTEIDGAGLQLVVAARREAARRGRPVTLAGASPAVAELDRVVPFLCPPEVSP